MLSSWLHSLKSGSLRDFRGGSHRHRALRVSSANPQAHSVTKSASPIRDAAARIDSFPSERLGLEGLAKEFGFSRAHFMRVFKAEFGISPHQYRNRRRLVIAKNLLRGTELRLIDIALDLGFCSQSHFTQTFRTYVGLTPELFRKQRMDPADILGCPALGETRPVFEPPT